MAKQPTEYTCAIFFKVTGDNALRALAAEMEWISVITRSQLVQIVGENKANLGSRYSEEKEQKRVPFIEARKMISILPEFQVHKDGKWTKA